MGRTGTALRLLLGGAIWGCFLGILGGAVAGAFYGAFRDDVSLGLDGAILGGLILALAGALYGGFQAWMEWGRRKQVGETRSDEQQAVSAGQRR